MNGFKAMFLGAPLVWKAKKHAQKISNKLRALQVCHEPAIDSFFLNLSRAGRARFRSTFYSIR